MSILRFTAIQLVLLTFGIDASYADAPPELDLTQRQEPKSKREIKIEKALAKYGITDPDVLEFANSVDSRVKDKYLQLNQQQIGDNTLTVHYELRGVGLSNMEVKFQPNDSNFALTGRKEEAMVRYQLRF